MTAVLVTSTLFSYHVTPLKVSSSNYLQPMLSFDAVFRILINGLDVRNFWTDQKGVVLFWSTLNM
jgi:hypothetical protein